MSIIKSNNANILSSRSEILKSLPVLETLAHKFNMQQDMLGQDLHMYDWVLNISSDRYGSTIRRIGVVSHFTPKKVSVLVCNGWEKVPLRRCVDSKTLVKLDPSVIENLKKMIMF